MPGRDNLSRRGRRAYATSVTLAYALLAVAGVMGVVFHGHLGLDSGWSKVLVGASGMVLTLGGSACAYFSARSLWLRELEFMWLVPLALTGYIATLLFAAGPAPVWILFSIAWIVVICGVAARGIWMREKVDRRTAAAIANSGMEG